MSMHRNTDVCRYDRAKTITDTNKRNENAVTELALDFAVCRIPAEK